jgi:hypothetical protein
MGAAMLAADAIATHKSAVAHECCRHPRLRKTIASNGPTRSARTSTTPAIAMKVPWPRLGTRVMPEKAYSSADRSASFEPLDVPMYHVPHWFWLGWYLGVPRSRMMVRMSRQSREVAWFEAMAGIFAGSHETSMTVPKPTGPMAQAPSVCSVPDAPTGLVTLVYDNDQPRDAPVSVTRIHRAAT